MGPSSRTFPDTNRRDWKGRGPAGPANQAADESGAGEGGARPARGDRWAETGTMHGGDATAISGAVWVAAPSADITIAGE